MVNEDFLRQLARQISKKVADSTATQTSENLAIFCDGVSKNLKTEVLAAYPNIRILENSHTEDLSQTRTVLLVAPSLDVASKIALLQTDNSIVDLIVRALYTGKRVVAVVEGMLAVSKDRPENASTGLISAVEELRNKLALLGIEITQDPKIVNQTKSINNVKNSHHLPVLQHTITHPSRERFQEPLNEFLDFIQVKQCTMEKNKPCDQCDICNSLGF